MENHYIEMFSPLWWKCSFFTLFAILSGLLLLSFFGDRNRRVIGRWIGGFLIFDTFLFQLVTFYQGTWIIGNSLPLHLCNIMALCAGLYLFTYSKLLYEMIFYLGILGPFQALLTPGFSHGFEGYVFYEYFIDHGLTIFIALYATFLLNERPRALSWLRIPMIFSVSLVPMWFFNKMFNANYLYINSRPPIDNPFNIGPWPHYIGFWILLSLLFSFILYIPFRVVKKSNSSQLKESFVE